jgi:hypothetical protein
MYYHALCIYEDNGSGVNTIAQNGIYAIGKDKHSLTFFLLIKISLPFSMLSSLRIKEMFIAM